MISRQLLKVPKSISALKVYYLPILNFSNSSIEKDNKFYRKNTHRQNYQNGVAMSNQRYLDRIVDLKFTSLETSINCMNKNVENMREDMREFKTDIKADMSAFKTDIKADMSSFKVDINKNISDFKKETLPRLLAYAVILMGSSFGLVEFIARAAAERGYDVHLVHIGKKQPAKTIPLVAAT